MTCPSCKTNNAASAKTCWSCGKELPRQDPAEANGNTSASHWNSNAKPSSSPSAPVQNINEGNDFLMGLLLGPIGIICATIIDKRVGFWSAFFGMVVVALVIGLILMVAYAK